MKARILTLAASVAVACGLASCATSYAVAPEVSQGQSIRYEHGTPTTVSVKEHGAVRVSPSAREFAGRMVFNVVAFNNGPQAANIGYENVSVALSSGTPLRLYSAAALEKEAKTRAAWAAFAVALSGAAQAYSAQQSAYSYGYGSVHTYTPYGGAVSTYQYSAYNPALANALTQQATAQTSRDIYQISAALDHAITSIEGHVLQTTTVDVGQINGGQIVVDRPKLNRDALTDVIVRVVFNGDVHEFKFRAGASNQIAQLPVAEAPTTSAAPPAPVPPAASAAEPPPTLPAPLPRVTPAALPVPPPAQSVRQASVTPPPATSPAVATAVPSPTKVKSAEACGVVQTGTFTSKFVPCPASP